MNTIKVMNMISEMDVQMKQMELKYVDILNKREEDNKSKLSKLEKIIQELRPSAGLSTKDQGSKSPTRFAASKQRGLKRSALGARS